MHFSGRTWRPHYEADSCIIELTAGCTYGKCNFCNLYENEHFRLSSLEQFEKDLQEIKDYQPYARRLFLTGANPFALSYESLKPYVLTVRDYLIKCQSIAMFASIRDIQNKKVWQLRKLDEAGIEYYFVYMTGLAGKGGGTRNAVNSAKLFSRLNPYFISVDALTLFPNTKLYDMAGAGSFIPAGEKERLQELQVFIRNLQIRTHLFANSSSNFYPLSVYLPKERESAISELQYVMDHHSEEEMAAYRAGLKSLE